MAPRKNWSAAGAWWRALVLVLAAWVVVAAIALASYLSLSVVAVPIVVGVVLTIGFVVAVVGVHQAFWLGFLALLPGVAVLVGAVQYAPEAALEFRGERAEVTVADVEVSGKRHEFDLVRTADGVALGETLVYQGSSPPYAVGTTLAVLVDPEGEVSMEVADRVDPAGKMALLLAGGGAWSVIGAYAARRGLLRRRQGKSLHDTPALY
ncbi:hypothetical protein RM844_10780 [Streptomyces sp. DSM 44915]|uniref:Integral membrane protein n=1 Tax=Streptomyces chisholmiae TaxID=3075540 RepID=A0ABU2JP69_9ACTN|nr:hypothetical protein [Streptomyces sp. DSM 44915]MDT0266776.1 hypothetical protein [Streptomyces sp. DSM 44915]